MKQFILLENTFIVTEERDNYNKIRLQFIENAHSLMLNFIYAYNENCHSIEDVLKKGFELGWHYINLGLQNAVEMLLKRDILTIDVNAFYNDYFAQFDTYDLCIEKITNKYIEIEKNQKAAEAYRELRKTYRAKWVGGGFSMSGALSAAAKASAMNMAADLGHSAYNFIGNSIDSIITSSKKSKLFNDSNTLNSLADSVRQNCYNIHYALIMVLRNYGVKNILTVSNTDKAKAMALLNNLQLASYPNDKRIPTIFTILELDPYNIEIYQYLIDTYGDPRGEINALAQYFGICINPYIEEKIKLHSANLLSAAKVIKISYEEKISVGKQIKVDVTKYSADLNYFSNEDFLNSIFAELDLFIIDSAEKSLKEIKQTLPTDTEEMTREAILVIINKQKEYGLDENNKEAIILVNQLNAQIRKHKENKFKEYYSQIPLEKLEDFESALAKIHLYVRENELENCDLINSFTDEINNKKLQMQLQMLESEYNSLKYSTEEEMMASKKSLVKFSQKIGLELSNPFVDKVTKMLEDYDLKERSFGKLVFSSRESAKKAKNDSEELALLFNTIEPSKLNREDSLSALIIHIRGSSCDDVIKGEYLSFLNARLYAMQFIKSFSTVLTYGEFRRKSSEFNSITNKITINSLTQKLNDLQELINEKGHIINTNDYKKSYNFAYKYQKSKEGSLPKEILSNIFFLTIIYFLSKFIIDYFDIGVPYSILILLVLVWIGYKAYDYYLILTIGKNRWYELIKLSGLKRLEHFDF